MIRGLGMVWLHNHSGLIIPGTRKCDPRKGPEMENNSRARVKCAGLDSY